MGARHPHFDQRVTLRGMSPLFVCFTDQSPLYTQCLSLRNRILRQPLGLTLSPQDTANESHDYHFALAQHDHVVACLILRPLANGGVRLRQMAVENAYQGQGLGHQLVQAVEQWCAQHAISHIETHARVNAEGFYASLGYEREGAGFTEIGIPHISMSKKIPLT